MATGYQMGQTQRLLEHITKRIKRTEAHGLLGRSDCWFRVAHKTIHITVDHPGMGRVWVKRKGTRNRTGTRGMFAGEVYNSEPPHPQDVWIIFAGLKRLLRQMDASGDVSEYGSQPWTTCKTRHQPTIAAAGAYEASSSR